MRSTRTLLLSLAAPLILTAAAHAQSPVTIDERGIMHWRDSGEELALFGVNYSVPFAHGYRAVEYVGADHEETIDRDVYHFARLGLDAYRIHVWDIEISDRQGNLVENEHLRLLDYLIMRLKERGIKIVLSTMRNADNAYPEGNDVLGWGFSRYWPKYGNVAHHTPEAIAAQQRYVQGFLNHVNEYTGLSYKEDPDIIAFEINNEPHHTDDVEDVRAYLDTMVTAMRATGLEKPIFYNMSHNFDVTDAFLEADIQGGTFQWYPTGLNAGFTQKGNFLPSVDNYPIPFAEDSSFQDKAKLIYEFSPADVMDSYMYLPMVREFREAGFQFITQFAYDPLPIAYENSEYKTHYLNLAYTPSKAIGFKVAGEAARRLPLGESQGSYPENTTFDGFRISYEEDLAEFVSDTAFFYSNTTTSRPDSLSRLQHLAGVGSSPVVQYEGTGSYFLDRLADGIWRLEVMPDAVIVNDPFDDPNLGKTVARIVWNRWPMTIALPDLGNSFTLRGISEGNDLTGAAAEGTFSVEPGVYLLTRAGVASEAWTGDAQYGNIRVGEFVAPPSMGGDAFDVLHTPPKEVVAGRPFVVAVDVVGPAAPEAVTLYYHAEDVGRPVPAPTMLRYSTDRIPMRRTHGYRYEAEVPDSVVTAGGGMLYYVVLQNGSDHTTYPGAVPGEPGDWDFYSDAYWGTRFVAADARIQLLDVADDFNFVQPLSVREGFRAQKHLVEGSTVGAEAIRIDARLRPEQPLFLREFIGDEIDGRRADLDGMAYVVIRARALNPESRFLQFGFLTTDGYTYAAPLVLGTEWQNVRIPVNRVTQTPTALRLTYPQMMDTYFIPRTDIPFEIRKIENWEIATGVGFSGERLAFEVENVWLE